MKRVTKKQSSQARNFANKLLKELQKELKIKYKFTTKLVGSAKYNTILKDEDGWFDVDYQIILTKNSKEYKKNCLSNSTGIKEDFFNFFNEKYKNNKYFKVENSTTAITLIDYSHKFSFDFVIIKLYPDNNEIIRRNNKCNSTKNEYTWNKLSDLNDAYSIFNDMNSTDKIVLIEEYILPRKIKEKKKFDTDQTKRTSVEVFIEEVNNYEFRRKNNWLWI